MRGTSTTSVRETLAAITAPLVEPDTSIGAVASGIQRLEALLEQLTPFRHADRIESGESNGAGGWAVSPTQAAMCARDYKRTYAFARGLRTAIDDAASRDPHAQVRVLYAGCGPWALIALPVLASAPAGTVRFTLLDLHEASIASVRALVASAGLDDAVDGIHLADATAWAIPPDRLPDVIVVETMNVCLEREPQVAIARNLLRQAPHARLIPRAVRVDAMLVDPDRERPRILSGGRSEIPEPDRIELGTVFEVSREAVAAWDGIGGRRLPAATIAVPASLDARYEPRLFTRIETYGGERVDAYESSLTMPQPFPPGTTAAPGVTVTFAYRLGAAPRLVCVPEVWPDRLRLPFTFDPARLVASLEALDARDWTDHFVTRNYDGRWSVIPLRAPAGTEHAHPILQITANPEVAEYVDTAALDEAPYLRDVIRALGFPVCAARLMRLDPGSVIKPHNDPGLAFEDGAVRLHIPIVTNPHVEFLLNGVPVVMKPSECWYLRLSDTHAIRNDGAEARVHLVVDAPVTPPLETVFDRAVQMAARQRS